MADNVAITAGSGTTIATDDVAGVHYQQVKLVASTLDSTEALTKAEDAAHSDGQHGIMMLGVRNYSGPGADGDYGAISLSDDGNVRVDTHKDQIRIAVTSSGLTTATTAYTAGDQVGTIFTFTNAVRVSGSSGVITRATLLQAGDLIGAYDLVLFRATVTLASDNAAFNISVTDVLNVIAVIPLSHVIDLGASRVAQALNIAIPYELSGTSLFGALVCRANHSFFGAATDLTVVLCIERN